MVRLKLPRKPAGRRAAVAGVAVFAAARAGAALSTVSSPEPHPDSRSAPARTPDAAHPRISCEDMPFAYGVSIPTPGARQARLPLRAPAALTQQATRLGGAAHGSSTGPRR